MEVDIKIYRKSADALRLLCAISRTIMIDINASNMLAKWSVSSADSEASTGEHNESEKVITLLSLLCPRISSGHLKSQRP